jgi:SNF2 family DNA or RNA helicase
VAELHRQLAPHMLRRLKKDVLKQLPPKMEQMVRHSFRGFVFDFGFGWDLIL